MFWPFLLVILPILVYHVLFCTTTKSRVQLPRRSVKVLSTPKQKHRELWITLELTESEIYLFCCWNDLDWGLWLVFRTELCKLWCFLSLFRQWASSKAEKEMGSQEKVLKTKVQPENVNLVNFIYVLIYQNILICLLILEREEGRERKKNSNVREKQWLVASDSHPYWGSNLQPRYIPWLGIEPSTFWYVGQCSNKLNYTSWGNCEF